MESRKFTDILGTSWVVEVDTLRVKRIRDELKIDLLEINGEQFTKMIEDPATIVDVLECLIREQVRIAVPTSAEISARLTTLEAELGRAPNPEEVAGTSHRGLGPYELARRLRGDVLDLASKALLQALIDFFPKRRRETLQAAMDKANEMLDRATAHSVKLIQSEKMETLIQHTLSGMDRTLDAEIARLTGSSSSAGPVPSASTQPA